LPTPWSVVLPAPMVKLYHTLLEPLPEIAKVARLEVDKGNPYARATHEDLRKLALRVEEVLQSPDVDVA
jgi:hypothetical protein